MTHSAKNDRRQWVVGLLIFAILVVLAISVAYFLPRHIHYHQGEKYRAVVRAEMRMGDNAQAQGEYEMALQRYRGALLRNPIVPVDGREVTNAMIRSSIIDTLIRLERFDDALVEVEELAESGETSERILRPLRAELYLHLGDWDEAAVHARRALDEQAIDVARTSQELAVLLALVNAGEEIVVSEPPGDGVPFYRALVEIRTAQSALDIEQAEAALDRASSHLAEVPHTSQAHVVSFDSIRSAWLLEQGVLKMIEGHESTAGSDVLRLLRIIGGREN